MAKCETIGSSFMAIGYWPYMNIWQNVLKFELIKKSSFLFLGVFCQCFSFVFLTHENDANFFGFIFMGFKLIRSIYMTKDTHNKSDVHTVHSNVTSIRLIIERFLLNTHRYF